MQAFVGRPPDRSHPAAAEVRAQPVAASHQLRLVHDGRSTRAGTGDTGMTGPAPAIPLVRQQQPVVQTPFSQQSSIEATSLPDGPWRGRSSRSSTDIDDSSRLARRIDICQYRRVSIPRRAMQATGALCCTPLTDAPLSQDDARTLAAQLKALADPGRLRLLSMLMASETGSACTCDLTGPLGLSQPTVTHHLRRLLDAGLVTAERRGSWTHYSVVPDALGRLAAALSAAPAAVDA
jgi:ArsR family transcriptional regulator